MRRGFERERPLPTTGRQVRRARSRRSSCTEGFPAKDWTTFARRRRGPKASLAGEPPGSIESTPSEIRICDDPCFLNVAVVRLLLVGRTGDASNWRRLKPVAPSPVFRRLLGVPPAPGCSREEQLRYVRRCTLLLLPAVALSWVVMLGFGHDPTWLLIVIGASSLLCLESLASLSWRIRRARSQK
jgi:hypothetical protein